MSGRNGEATAVPVGYTMTEVGVIPSDWEVKRLGELGDAIIGLTYSPSEVEEFGKLVLRSSNIQNDSLDFQDNVFVNKMVPEHLLVQKGDILICARNGSRQLIGKSALIDERASGMTFGAFMAIFRSSIGPLILYYFKSKILKSQIDRHLGATINQVTNKSLRSFRIPLPSNRSEQRAIATALSDTDALIESLEALIAKKRRIKEGTMRELLSGERRLDGFEGEWVEKPVSSLGEVVTGSTPPTNVGVFWGGTIPWITPTDITDSPFVSFGARSITQTGLSVLRPLPAGAVLVTCIASIGKNAILRQPGACNQQINAVIPNTQTDSSFLFYAIEASVEDLRNSAGITATSIISKSQFSKFILRVPGDFAEQKAIATILTDMDTEIESLEEKLAKVRRVKEGMMGELLMGRVRLVGGEA